MNFSPDITPERIRSLVKSELKLVELPMNESFHNLGASHAQLIGIQNRLNKTFGRGVSTIFFTDTVYSIHEKITTKPNTHERIKH